MADPTQRRLSTWPSVRTTPSLPTSNSRRSVAGSLSSEQSRFQDRLQAPTRCPRTSSRRWRNIGVQSAEVYYHFSKLSQSVTIFTVAALKGATFALAGLFVAAFAVATIVATSCSKGGPYSVAVTPSLSSVF